jgi:hypothetical protein
VFSTPKTEAGMRQMPLSSAARELIAAWKPRAVSTDADALVFATGVGSSISPNNIPRRARMRLTKSSISPP